ncbi:MAG TPA: hypothetical protein VEU54_10665 [Steroidobacteraceae bacterium]|jgi:hypothetical protein|nr:hypothetical protein [Steroidobacteraceae bacterium]
MEFLLIDLGVAVAGFIAYRSLALLSERRATVTAWRRQGRAPGSRARA